MTTTPNAFGVDDNFGSGGTGLAPDGASGASSGTGTPANARDLFRALLGALWAAGYADTTALTASKAVNRQDGQLVIKQDDYSLWVWKAADATAADGSHIAPTDVGVGAGRWVIYAVADSDASDSTDGLMSAADKTKLDAYAATPGTNKGEIICQKMTWNTAALNALTSGAAFNVGAALPANAVLAGFAVSWVAMTGGSLSAVSLVIGDAGTANDILTATSTFTTGKTSGGLFQLRGAAQIQATLTATDDTLAHATAGSLVIDLFYFVPATAP